MSHASLWYFGIAVWAALGIWFCAASRRRRGGRLWQQPGRERRILSVRRAADRNDAGLAAVKETIMNAIKAASWGLALIGADLGGYFDKLTTHMKNVALAAALAAFLPVAAQAKPLPAELAGTNPEVAFLTIVPVVTIAPCPLGGAMAKIGQWGGQHCSTSIHQCQQAHGIIGTATNGSWVCALPGSRLYAKLAKQ